jgi:hypothetical protein
VTSLLDHPVLAGRLFFPRRSALSDPFWVTATDGTSQLACFRTTPHPGAPTVIHFHGNGEVVSDYVPDMAEELAKLGVNVLFAEYRGYGASTGAQPALGAMLDDAAAIVAASGERSENVILFGRPPSEARLVQGAIARASRGKRSSRRPFARGAQLRLERRAVWRKGARLTSARKSQQHLPFELRRVYGGAAPILSPSRGASSSRGPYRAAAMTLGL